MREIPIIQPKPYKIRDIDSIKTKENFSGKVNVYQQKF